MRVTYGHVIAIKNGDKIARKPKKRILGFRLSKSKLRKLLSSVKIGVKSKTMYETSEIHPFLFCPKCGCKSDFGTGNLTSYPEHWEKFHCTRCKNIVGYIDNSPFIHALECAENDYDPTF